MSKFREFLISEAGATRPFGPRVSTIAGRLDLPDLSAASQLGQTKMGGYSNFSDMQAWLAQQAQYNIRYPIESHGQIAFEVNYSYEQMRRALTQLGEIVEGIYGVLASDITQPNDPKLSSYIRYAHFEGQTRTSADINNPNINMNIIRKVDIKALVGRITGGTGMQSFILADNLGIIEQSQDLPPNAPHDSLFDIFIDKLKNHMEIALRNMTDFEKTLMSTGFMAHSLDHIIGQMGKGHLGPTLGTDPMAFRGS